jgi:hypothetical protein
VEQTKQLLLGCPQRSLDQYYKLVNVSLFYRFKFFAQAKPLLFPQIFKELYAFLFQIKKFQDLANKGELKS